MELYRHSGKLTLIGIPITVGLGLAAAAALGFVYSYINVYNPLIYVNILCILGFGYGIGVAVAKGVRIGKIRNPLFAGFYGLVFALAGLYFAWVADFWARLGQHFQFAAFQPDVLKEYIAWFYENGAWSIDNHGQHAETVKGVFLAIIWIVEAATIIGFATVWAYRSVASLPFCEACNEWTKPNLAAARIKYDREVQSRLAAADLSALDQALTAKGSENVFTQLDLYCCPKCDKSIFLTVNSMSTQIDKKGNRKTTAKPLLRFLVIDGAEVPRILEAGRRASPASP